jgi:hypothetical protein
MYQHTILQVDQEPSIRANTTVLLGNIAQYLGDQYCKKVMPKLPKGWQCKPRECFRTQHTTGNELCLLDLELASILHNMQGRLIVMRNA